MFKLVVLCVLVTAAVAKPSYYHGEVAAPIIAQAYVSPAAVSNTYREDVISKPAYVAAPIVAKAVLAEPLVVAKTIVSPAAVSHTYREDVVSQHAPIAYAAPAVAYATPLVQSAIVAAPVAYSAPAAVSHSYRSDFVNSPVLAADVYNYGPAVHAW